MEETIIVVGATRYQFNNDAGQVVEGCKVNYLTSTRDDETNRIGFFPLVANLPLSAWNDLGQMPGIYSLRSKPRPNSRGKVELRPVDIRYVQAATDLSDLLAALDDVQIVKK